MKRVKKLLAFLLAFALVFGSLQSGVMTVAAETGSEAAEAADDGQASDDTPSTEEEVAEEENEEEEPADDTAEEDAASDEQASLKAAADEPAAAEEAVAEASASDPEATDESVEDAEEDESIEPDAETEDAQPEESDEAEEEAEPAEDDSSETEEPQDEEKEDAEETEEESDDLFVLETTQGDVTVRISGTADTLAGVVSVSVTELNDERIVAYEEAFAEDDSITVSEVIAAYDITLLDADGKAVEPNGSVSVSITSKTLQEYLEEGEDIQVIHDTNTTVEAVEDDSIDSETVSVDALEVMDVESDDSGEVNFTADSFSTYVITVSSASVFPSDGVLADDTTYELSSNITLAKDLTVPAGATVTIDLKGFTLTGTGTSPVITVNGNLTIQDTSSGTTSGYIDADTGLWMAGTSEDEDDITQNLTGGVITGGKTGTVVQYSDDNNEPLGSGIYVDGGNLTLVSGNIAGNDFSNATTDLKDGYRISNGGGVAVCNEGTFTMSGGNVVGNVARIAGGVWCGPDCTFNLDGGNVSYNTALYGGGVEAWGSNAEIIVDGGDITYNSAENGLGGGMGGGAYIQNNGQLTLKSGSISNNTAEYRGGAIIGNANGATISIQGGTVDHNKITCAGSHNVYAGAAIYLAGTSSETYASLIMTGGSISNNVFADTTAERNGGAIYAGGYAKIELSGTAYISENSAKLGGAIYCYENASVSLSGSASITGNNVTSQGGAIYCRNYASVSLSGNASITGNSAGTSGGAIYLKENANLEISDSAVISANSAVTSGGGIAMDDSTLTMTGGSVKNNNTSSTASGSGKGGAIYASSDATVKLSGTAAISGNSARLGAGIYLDGSSAELEIAGNVEISGNTSNLGGGGIYLYKSTLTMTGGSITGNKTGSNGGGVYVFDSDTKMSVSGNPVITGNTMSSDDSANNVYLPSSTYITLADDGLTSGAEIGVTVASNTNTDTYSSNNTPTGRQVTTAEAETTSYYASAYRYIVPDVSSFTSGTTYTVLSQVDADDSKNYVEFVLTSDETYTVTLNLTGLTADAATTLTLAKGTEYTVTLTPVSGYTLPSSIKMKRTSDTTIGIGETYYGISYTTDGEIKIPTNMAETKNSKGYTFTASGVARELTAESQTVSGTYSSDFGTFDLRNYVYYKEDTSAVPTADFASFVVESGSIPDGLTMNAKTGVISGTPTAAGTYTAAITVTAKNGKTLDVTVAFNIAEADPKVELADKGATTYSGNSVEIGEAVVTLAGDDVYLGTITYTYYTDENCTTLTSSSDGAETEGGAPANAGTYYVIATTEAFANYNAGTSNKAKLTIIESDMDATAEGYAGVYDGQAHSATVTVTTPSDATIEYSTDGTNYSSENPSYTSAGSYTVYYRVTKANYTTFAGSVGVSISPAAQSVSYAEGSVSVTYGDDAFTNALTESTVYGTVTYSSSDTSVATVDSSTGEVTIVGAGVAVITASVSGSSDYQATTASYVLTVDQAAQTISYATTSVSKTTGDAAFTNALTETTVYGTITYSSSNTSVATVDGNGKVTIVGTGTTTITATVSGSDDYTSASASYTLTVNAAGSSSSSSSSGSSGSSSSSGSSNSSSSSSSSSTSTVSTVSTTASAQTGDSANPLLWAVLMMAALAGISGMAVYSRRKRKSI